MLIDRYILANQYATWKEQQVSTLAEHFVELIGYLSNKLYRFESCEYNDAGQFWVVKYFEPGCLKYNVYMFTEKKLEEVVAHVYRR